MIYRIWHGWTEPSNADAYQELLERTIVPGIFSRNITGLRSLDILRDDGGPGEVGFVTIMTFEDQAAVDEFAGPDPAASVVPPDARALLSRFDEHSQHYRHVARTTT